MERMIGEAGRWRVEDLRAVPKAAAMRLAFALELLWRLVEARVLELDFQRAPAPAVEGRNWRVWQAERLDAAERW